MAGITFDCSTSGTWTYWVCGSTATATAIAATATVWYDWVVSDTVTCTADPRIQHAVAEDEKKRAEIRKKAEAWLLNHLSTEQQREYSKHRKFTVYSQDRQRRYEIESSGTVFEVNNNGKRIRSFCIHSRANNYPVADEICVKKILLECDEQSFLKTANATQLRAA